MKLMLCDKCGKVKRPSDLRRVNITNKEYNVCDACAKDLCNQMKLKRIKNLEKEISKTTKEKIKNIKEEK